MSDNRLNVILRSMQLTDIDEVVEIDKLAFPTPWPPRTYRYEILNNDRSTMIVLENNESISGANGSGGFTGWLKRFTGEVHIGALMGYAGMWHIADEAHISTIAVHPDWRGLRLGELMVWSMVRRAIQDDARMVTLEVRVTNSVAQGLYRKYNFEVMGRRKGYYRDNGEDAYMMGVTTLDELYRKKLVGFGKELAQSLHVTDRFR